MCGLLTTSRTEDRFIARVDGAIGGVLQSPLSADGLQFCVMRDRTEVCCAMHATPSSLL